MHIPSTFWTYNNNTNIYVNVENERNEYYVNQYSIPFHFNTETPTFMFIFWWMSLSPLVIFILCVDLLSQIRICIYFLFHLFFLTLFGIHFLLFFCKTHLFCLVWTPCARNSTTNGNSPEVYIRNEIRQFDKKKRSRFSRFSWPLSFISLSKRMHFCDVKP